MSEFSHHEEFIKKFLPRYLTPEAKEKLLKNVQQEFPLSNNPNKLFRDHQETEIYYQGDGLVEIPFSRINRKEGKFDLLFHPAVVLSNTCDIAPENENRLERPLINFASIFNLEEYIKILEKRKIKKDRIRSFLNDLKNNCISNLFFLPGMEREGDLVIPDSFIRFDYTVSLPEDLLYNEKISKEYSPKGLRLFTFSDYGFYLFLLKLSVHFCRFREGVFRS